MKGSEIEMFKCKKDRKEETARTMTTGWTHKRNWERIWHK
jgi:hypothetical protein